MIRKHLQLTILAICFTGTAAVGERLVEQALTRLYGNAGVSTAASFASAHYQQGQVLVSFQDLKGELTSFDGASPSWFELSADGTTYVAASASLVGAQVEVVVPQNFEPRYVRMGWRDIAIPNLEDGKTGWPVLAFPG